MVEEKERRGDVCQMVKSFNYVLYFQGWLLYDPENWIKTLACNRKKVNLLLRIIKTMHPTQSKHQIVLFKIHNTKLKRHELRVS